MHFRYFQSGPGFWALDYVVKVIWESVDFNVKWGMQV